MLKQRFHTILSLLLLTLLLFSVLPVSGCAQTASKGILQERADEITATLSAAISAKADALTSLADGYEASGEILTDEDGAPVDMTAYIAFLRADASAIRSMTFNAYNLAILDDIYSRSYIRTYRSLSSLSTEIVELLVMNFDLSEIKNEDDANELIYACYMFATGDVYGAYVNAAEAEQEQAGDDSYVGIGVTVTQLSNGYVEVISVNPDSPAKEAGIAEGDILIAVNGESVLTLGYDKTVDNVRGAEGTAVSLTFKRGDAEYTVSVTRKKLINLTVSYKMLADGETGYIRISQFEATTFTQFVAAVEALEALGATAFVFDVRNDPGGHLETVLGILEYIVPDDKNLPLIRMEYTDETVSYYSVEEYLRSAGADDALLARYESAKNHSINARMAVLCNEYTASAGELFTSCLKDFGVAEVFGTVTYGKGVGQSGYSVTDFYAYLANGQYACSTVSPGYFRISAFFYSPPVSDNYDGVGVEPHHIVNLSEEAQAYHVTNIPEDKDNQLGAAVAFLKSNVSLSPAPDGSQNTTLPPTDGGTGALPSGDEEKDSLGGVIALFTVFGVLVGIAVALSVYLVVDRVRRKANRQKSASIFTSDNPNDN